MNSFLQNRESSSRLTSNLTPGKENYTKSLRVILRF